MPQRKSRLLSETAELTYGIRMIIPKILRNTVGVVIVASRKYIDWLEVLHRYVSFISTVVAEITLISYMADMLPSLRGH